MGAGRKLLLLMWKNWLLQKRKVVLTIFEIGLPCVFGIMLLLFRQLVPAVHVDDATSWPSFQVDAFPDDLNPPSSIVLPNRSWELLYTPDNTAVGRVVDIVTQRLNMKPGGTGFATEEDLVNHMQDSNKTKTMDVLGGIVFTNNFSTEQTLPKKITYKVRLRAEQYNSEGVGRRLMTASDWYTDFMFPIGTSAGPRQNASAEGGNPGYYREGFLALQRAVDTAIIMDLNNASDVDDIDVELKRHPYPPHIDDPFVDMLRSQLPVLLLLGFIVIAPNIVKDLVLEKERKLKESMKMMGLNNWIHWLAWFLKYLFFMLVTVFFLTLFFTIRTDNGAVLRYSDPSIIFVFFLLYGISTVMFCFAISVFFSKSSIGAAAGGIVFLATYFLYSYIHVRNADLSVGEKMFASLLHNVCMGFGCLQITGYEDRGIGLQWTNFYKSVTVDDNFPMLYVFLMFVLDMFIYGLVTWYFDAILPGDFGIPKRFYFPFTKSYWCGRNASKVSCTDAEIGQMNILQLTDYFESYSPDAKAGICIRNLRKEFKKRKVTNVAVNDMNIDMLEGQITALLGHNGAGKTTTMFMLTGFIPPTSGAAYVNGFDIRTDIDMVRQNLGLCPQHDVLFDTMTVVEHLTFFAKLKGCPSKSVEKEVDTMIEVLHLEDKRLASAKSLSGGMRRKLSVGIALIAGSKFVILDEPTSGMDPAARRQTWEILQNQRQGRTMILSTHYMDEADLLGDRIAIMANGVIQCCGSSLFLKKKYGIGYHMVIVKQPDCNVSDVTNVVLQYVPQAKLESNVSAELSYILPSDSSDKFENLFETLEKNRATLGIASYGASVTTMEDVFLRVGESVDESLEKRLHADNTEDTRDTAACTATMGVENEEFITDGLDNKTIKPEIEEKSEVLEENNELGSSFPLQENGLKLYRCPDFNPPPPAPKNLEPVFGVTFQRNSGVKLLVQQFRAMFQKRVIHSWRNLLMTITQILLPLGFTTLACIILISAPGPRDPPPLDLSLEHFQAPIAPYATDIDSTTDRVQQLTEKYVSYLENQSACTPYINENDDYKDDPDLEQYLLDVSVVDLDRYIRDYMVAGSFEGVEDGVRNKTVFQGYFNNEAYHTPAISLSVVGNTLLQYFVNSSFSIQTTNHPLPRALETQIEEDINRQYTISFVLAYTICFGMAFLVGTFVVFLIKERAVKAKHIQFVSGVHVANFWMSTFAWDLTNFLIPSLLMLAVFAAFSIDAYIEDDNAGYTLMIFLFFGFAVLPCVYLLSFPFSVAATGYVWITILNLMAGSAAMLFVWLLKFPPLGIEDVGIALEWTFYILLPNYCFGTSLRDLYSNHEIYKICGQLDNIGQDDVCKRLEMQNATNPCCKDICGNNCAVYQSNYLAWEAPGIGRGLTFMGIQCIFCFTLLFIIESGYIRRLWQKAVEGTVTSQPADQSGATMSMSEIRVEEDEDVAAERARINNTPVDQVTKTDTLVLKELKKYYGPLLAVDRLSLGISQGDCFGLLGINGAGKTTTFKMLTGDETISSGCAYLSGYSVKAQIKEVQQQLGYCPQFDALIDEMTVKETLRMYARLRGVHEDRISDVVDAMVSSLILDDHADKLAGDLSGGNKRKLNTAIALVGDPQIVFLDEPTTGMDPVARRLLWDTLSKVRSSGRTLVLTSHSMEECEALCTRLAIMVNGEFTCLGSTQHLKNKFGEGYTLTAKVKTVADGDIEETTAALRAFIEKTFPSSVLKDLYKGLVHYHIPNTQLTWAQIFGTMERAKVIYGLEDYSVSQTTLEQVFLNFARAQLPPREDEINCKVKTKNCCNYCCCCGCTHTTS